MNDIPYNVQINQTVLNECKYFAQYVQDFGSVITETQILHVLHKLVLSQG